MNKSVKYYIGPFLFFGTVSVSSFANMTTNAICENSFENVSTAPSAIKLQIIDSSTRKVLNVILRNDDYYSYVLQEKRIVSQQQYIKFLHDNIGTQHVVDLAKLQSGLEKRWAVGNKKVDAYFERHVVFDEVMTLEGLHVKDKDELAKVYFDFRNQIGYLKKEYYEQFNQKPGFVALLIDLGFDVRWGDIAPVLMIAACASNRETPS